MEVCKWQQNKGRILFISLAILILLPSAELTSEEKKGVVKKPIYGLLWEIKSLRKNSVMPEAGQDHIIVTNSPFQHNGHFFFTSFFLSNFVSGGSETTRNNFKINLLVPVGGFTL